MSTPIDLSLLAAPRVVEILDYESILADMLADLQSRDAAFDALLESDPAYKILEVAAYRELLLRQRINDAARSVLLAYAAGSDLDHLAALYGVVRLIVDPGDPVALPPLAPTYESDDALRRRVQMAPEGWTTAGSRGSYEYHTLSASALVKDVAVSSPAPGEVLVTVLSTVGDGTPAQELLALVESAVSAETVRPLCDAVTVAAAEIVPYTVTAGLTMFSGPDASTVLAAAQSAALGYVAESHALGRAVTISGLHAALHQPGVQNVLLSSPVGDVVVGAGQAPWCQSLTVTEAGVVDG